MRCPHLLLQQGQYERIPLSQGGLLRRTPEAFLHQ